MRHLTSSEIEELVEDGARRDGSPTRPYARESRDHLATCAQCRERVANAQRIERALARLPRATPAPDLSTRILTALPAQASDPATTRRLRLNGLAVAITAWLGLVFVYRTAFDLQSNGALELLSIYTSQPDIVATYPWEALTALFESLPWMTMALTLGVLVLTFALARQLWTRLTLVQEGNGHMV